MSHKVRINNNVIQITDLLKCLMQFEEDGRLTPSRYNKEVGMNVDERLKLLNDRSRKQKIGRHNKLWTIPDIVVFQNFETHVSYSTTISFMHQKQHPVRIKVLADLSPSFSLKELPGTVYSKLAPGTPHKMTLDFYSEEYRDYSCLVRFEADNDVVHLPIVALAPRPIIIFPDVIEMTETVVNISSDKKVFMRNMGKSPVVFKLKADPPFSVCPRTGIMEPNEILDVKVSYKTFRVEKNVSDLIISFEGVDLYATLKCEAKNCELYLDKTILYFEDTFLNLQRCISLNLINRSDYTMKYQWKQFKTKYEDMERCKEFRSKLEDLNEYEVLRNIQDENPNITDADLHRTFLQRIYEDELAEFDSTDQFLFHDPNFKFLENSGFIGPHSTVNIEVIFCPNAAEHYQSIAYLDVTGRETRQPLKMLGTGLGPEVCLNFKVLDVENLYLCAKHQYEIVAKNEGNIPATLSYSHKNMDFGGSMSCSPDEVYINPGKCEKMVLEFSSTVQGKFLENLNFRIAESGEYVSCVFQGNVVCPLLSYNIQEIDFGIVAFGFAVEKEISIQNTTEVPIEFRICVLNDGTSEAITWVNFSRSHNPYAVSKNPKEFNIYPDEATVAGNSAINIKITLVPNKAQKQSTFLHTYMWGSRKHYVELPIYYNCMVPNVECSPPRVDIRYCFINCPYDRIFTIKNISEVPGYILYHDMDEDDQGLSCKLSLTESYIEPGEEITIHLEIKGLQLGLHTKHLNFTVFGSEPNDLCKLTCDVQGPVICVNPEEIKFGYVALLKWHSRKLNVMNDSPVPAFISIHVANPTFHVNPSEFKLEASEKLEVDISIYLTNVAKYTSILILNIVNSMDPLKVHVSAFGVGSCILFEPILEPKYDLGTLMTHNTFRVPFKMTNMGKDMQRFIFSKVKDLKSMKEETESIRGYPFLIEPSQFEMPPKEQKTAYIEVYYTIPGLVELMYYCYSVDKTSKFTKIFEVKLFAHFEDPVLKLSKSSLHFRMDVTVDNTDAHLQEVYTVTNESYLALDIYVILTHPFYAIDEHGSKTSTLNVNVASKTSFSFFVEFVPPSGVKKCLVSTGTMKIGFKLHPKVFTITLTGDVNYPTLFTYPEAIKNQHIAPTANCTKELIIKNISPLPVAYTYEWEVASYTLEKLPTPRYNLSSLENSHDWKLDKVPRIPDQEPSFEEISTNEILELLVLDDEDPRCSQLPNLKIIYETLLENVRFPRVHPDVTRKLQFLSKFFLFPITENASCEVDDFSKILENMPRRKPDVNEAMLNITPYRGCLQPYECSLVNFYIRPPVQTFLKANAKCRILGGAEEKIEISAVCGDIAYDISKMEIHFGYQLFCESLEEQINLYNTGHVGFEYAVLDDSNNPKPKIIMDTATIGLLTVTPNMGILAPNECANLRIKYFPGITGEFNEYFVIEIGYLGPITLEVTGFAVYSQLYVLLPRPSLFEVVEPYLCYIAIGQLSKDPSILHYHMKNIQEDNKLDEITTLILEKEDWFVVEYDDVNIPSLVDIDMAIERMIGHEFLQNNPQLLGERVSIRKKHFTIPNFLVPTYELHFGNVRRDGQYEQNVSVYNYGPTSCIIKLFVVDQKYLESRGFFVELNCQKIKLGEYGNLNVKFKPNVKGVDVNEPFVSEVICIEVNQGARIPIRLMAFVGIPTTELSVQCMDFCGVVVGSCKRKIICLYNVGFVETKWTCSIDTPIFFTRKKEGLLAAGESEEIQVFFEPKTKGPRQGVLTFHIEGNTEDLTAYLNGYGREPNFVIKESIVQFPPVLQYSPALEETFLIQNTSSFPTEVFMCDYDRQIALHERICQVFWREMNAKKLYVARSLYGSTPSDIYRYLYKVLLLDRLTKEKSFTEVMKLSRTDVRGSSESVEHLLDALELRVDSSIAKRRPPQDIFLDADIEDDKPIVERNTKIIVFHGNKYTDYLKAANDASRMLRIPRYTLDGMIIEMLVENRTAFTKEVNEIIEEAYSARMSPEDCFCRESTIEDSTEELWRKMNIIHSMEPITKTKPKKEPKVKPDKGDSLSMTSSKMSRRTLSTNTADTFQGIPEDMIIQILSDKIDQIDKMILDSLQSIFLPNVQVALKCFLKAAKDIPCVYFVFFTCTLEEHTALETEEEEKKAAREANRKQALRKKLLEIDEYTSLTEEEREILMGIQEEKRERSNQKRADLRTRIQDDLKERGQEPKSNDLKTFWAHLDNSFLRAYIPKYPSKSLRGNDSSHQQHSMTSVGKESKGTKSPKDKKPKKERPKEQRPPDETCFYFYQYDIKLSEMLFLLEHWNRKELELEKDFPNFASLMASNRKDVKYTSKDFLKKASRSKSKSLLSSFGTSTGTTDNEENEKVVNTTFNPDIGYPVWVINQAHKKRSTNIIEPIMDLLKQMFSVNCLTSTGRVCKETEVLYTVLTKPTPRKYKEKLDVFDLVRCETRGESSTNESLTPVQPNEDERSSNTTLNVATRKKQKKRRLTLTPTASEQEEISNVHARFLLEPGSIQELNVLFKPLYCGFFKYVFNFEVVGTYYKEKVVVQASCDYPRIDTSPYTLFPHQVHSVDSKTMFLNGVYVISQQTLDFGTILLVPQHLLQMKSSISMLNTSGMTCEIIISFKTDSNVFYCEEDQKCIEVKPGRQHVLPVYARPPEEGLFKETLLITIKNNPRVQEIHLSCFACKLKFEVTPKTVNFNKVILGKTESEKITFRNYTTVMVYFEFEVDVNSEFRISTFNGYLDPCSSLDVTVTFIPEIIGDRKQSLILRVFDKEKQFPEPIYKEVLNILAEVATFPLEYSTSIDLGLVKGKTPHFFPFTINNTGKYDVKILLTKPILEGYAVALADCFKMKHMEYVVLGNSKYSNNCRFTCDKEVSFVDCPVVHVTILDNYRNSAIDHFTFNASARVALSKFELCPHGEYFFGYQNVNTVRSSLLTLKNIGDFDFKFSILTPSMVEEQALKKESKKEGVQMGDIERVSSIPSLTASGAPLDKKSLDKSTRSTTSRKKGKLKSKSRSNMSLVTEITAGTFTIWPANAVVQPGESVTITIDSKPVECEKYKETIIFFVSEPSFQDRRGRRLNLHVEGTEPRIDFNDYRFMFPLDYVVANIEDLPYVGENFVFETNKKILHFGKVALDNSVSTKFRVPNVGHVTATVRFEIRENCGFSVESKVIDIAPYKAEYNTIEFTPKAVGIWTGILEMKCLGSSSDQEISCKINLMGEACMPTIEIMEPEYRVNGEDTQLCFGPIPVKSSCERSVIIRNRGQVKCKVVVEIIGDPDWFLTLSLRAESEGDDEILQRSGNKHCDVFSLNVEEKGYINIKFEAKSSAYTDADLNIIVMNNCFDVWRLHLNTFAFDALVCLEDLPVDAQSNKRIGYDLNFGPVDKNELHKIVFRIKNVSNSVYKFQFGKIRELTFSPSVGHLYEGTEKTVIAAFRTKRHIDMKQKEIFLTITEIKYHPRYIFPLPWDDRQNTNIAIFKTPTSELDVSEVPCLEDAVYESNEPPYDEVDKPTFIPLFVNAQCGYANYFCETQELNFPQTFVHTMFTKTINVENRSNVNLEINWTITDYLDTANIPSAPRPSLFEKMQISKTEVPALQSNEDSKIFSIEPISYVIPPGKKHEFSIHHTPVEEEVREFYLRANIQNLEPSTNDLVIILRGESKSFPYHMCSSHMKDFEASENRFKTYCGLPEGVERKILNFLSLGIGSECNRALFVTNATFHPFSFVWRNINMDHEEPSFFHCEFNKGFISPRKATRTNFVFIPQSHGLFTDYFLFEPDDPYMPRCSLLLQGLCREPKVFFERASLALGATLLNDLVQKEIILRNDEDIKIHYSFKKNSLFSDNQQIVSVSPMSGLMESKSRNKIRLGLTLRPTKDGETIFTPNCIVQYMSEPLRFNLLMNVIHVSTKLIYFGRELSQFEVEPNAPLTINLGMIVPHKREEIKFELLNTSTIGLYYSWSTEDKQLRTKIQFNRKEGYLRSSEKVIFKASLLAIRKCILKNISLTLKILYGPTYVLKVEASTQKPKFTFSFSKYDFGKCLIQEEPTNFYRAALDFKNNNQWPVVLEYGRNCIPEFFVDFKSAVVSPEECTTIYIYFSPLLKAVYESALNFFVDSKKVVIRLNGEGVPLALEVLSLSDKFLDFGRVRVGKSVQKSIKVLNSGECTVDVLFALSSKLPYIKKKMEKQVAEFCIEPARVSTLQEDTPPDQRGANKKKGKPGDKDDIKSVHSKDERSMKMSSKETLTKYTMKRRQSDKVSRVISLKSLEKMHTDSEMQIMQSKEQLNRFLAETVEVFPKKMVKIPPNKTADVLVKFKPTETKEKFQSNIFFQVQNHREPILTIMGSCVDASFALNKDVINFGNVVVGYSSEETIILINDGYIGGRFRWVLEKNSSYVSFIGGEGYSPPNSKVTTTIIFKPGHVQCVFKFKAYCQIEKYKKRLELILTGGSMNLPPPIETLQFSAAVREEGYQNIEFNNDTKDTWNTEPVFTGNYFSGPQLLNVPKESSVTYQVVYAPMKMSPSQHKGTVFFPLPSGMSRLYALEGVVLPPNPVAEISREISCKTYHSEILKVQNWLGLRQQFKIITEVLDGNTTRMIYKITSNDYVEVPPFGKRDFKWTIYVVNEGRMSFKVTFLNEKTKDFLYYVISLKITPLEVTIDNVELVTCVRVPVIKKIVVQNPLPEAVDFNVTSSSPNVIVSSSFVALPFEKYDLNVKYLPVKVESTTAVLTISNPSVGNYTYNLILEAQAPNSEPEVKFRTQFGQNVLKTIPLPKLLQSMDVSAKVINNTSFEVVKINSQSEKPYMDVLFFPSNIGITRAALDASSYVGDYTFPLVGESVYPEPQGPYTIALGESMNIDINNPFEEPKTFRFSVDNPVFHVRPSEDLIKGKKSAKIAISVPSSRRLSKSRSGTSMSDLLKAGKFTGKLTVLCENDFKWIYYLQCQAGNK